MQELTEGITQADTAQDRLQLLSDLKLVLMSIRDRIIGNSCCKYFFVRNGLLAALTPLLWLRDESSAEFTRLLMDCQKDALTLLSVLIAQGGNGAIISTVAQGDTGNSEVELFSNLMALLHSCKEIKFLEILTRSLVHLARKAENVRAAIFEASTLSALLSFLEAPIRTAYSSAVTQNICGILAAGCTVEAKSRVLLSARVLPQLLALLTGSVCIATGPDSSASASIRIGVTDLKILDGSVELLGTLTRDCQEACEAASSAPVSGRRLPHLLFSLLSVSLLSVELKLKIALL